MKRVILIFCVVIIFANLAMAFEPLFEARIDYSTLGSPISSFAADLDGDGNKDLAVANEYSVSILINIGNGTFLPPVRYFTGSGSAYAGSIFAADLDGDSDNDLAVTDYGSNNVSILTNNGDGTFQPAVNYSTGTYPVSLFAVDLDGDGDNDLAVANEGIFSSPGNISIFKNNGDGTFQARVNYDAGGYPMAVFAADLDSDGDNDLAVANYGSNNVSILSNNGDGTFLSAVNYGSGGTNPYSVFAADLDSDGDKDLAVANYNGVAILKNNGDGTFQTASVYSAGSGCRSVYAADIDGDGDNDLTVANSNSHNVSILKNNGNGTFQTAVNWSVGRGPWSAIAADLDSDGNKDLAVANFTSGNVSILINRGDGIFPTAPSFTAGTNPYSVFAADLDGDGDNDLAVANYNSYNVSILINNGNGAFQTRVNYSVGGPCQSVFVADLDGDGDNDLAVAKSALSGTIAILMNNGNGTFQAPVNYSVGANPYSVFACDLDGDGDRDLAVANKGSNNVSILRNNGDGTFQTAVNYGVGSAPYFVFAADLDGDTKIDLVVANYNSNNLSILKNNGDGTFQASVYYGIDGSPESIFAIDLDNDNDNDLAVADGYVSILKNNGNGTFQAPVNYNVGSLAHSIFAIDIDGDGYNDLSVANSYNVSFLQNNGDGTFQAAVNYGAGTSPMSAFAADLDGDGNNDLAVANYGSNNVSILLNTIQAGTVAGSVFEFNGVTPVANAVVKALQGGMQKGIDTTNAEGSFIINMLSPGIYDISFSINDYYDTLSEGVSIQDNDTTVVNMMMRRIPQGAIKGIVTNTADFPLPGVRVIANGTAIEDTTDPNGAYLLSSLAAGIYNITFSHIDYRDTFAGGVIVVAGDTTILDIAMYELPGAIRGIISDTTASALPGVRAVVNGTSRQDTTDINGAYLLGNLASGSYSIIFSLPGYYDTTESGVIVNPRDTTILNLIMHQKPGWVMGDLTYNRDLPIESVRVEITNIPLILINGRKIISISASGKKEPTNYTSLGKEENNKIIYSDSTGHYEAGLFSGIYDLHFSHPLFQDEDIAGQVIMSGDTTLLNVRLIKMCEYMTGDINSDGQRIGGDVTYGVRYFKSIGPPPPDSCYMDSTGTFLYVAGDVNGNCEFRGSDITRLVAFFKGFVEISCCHFFPTELPLKKHRKIFQSPKE
jgi:hypothetical protein